MQLLPVISAKRAARARTKRPVSYHPDGRRVVMRRHDEMEYVLKALRIAELAHRTRARGAHSRKAPRGEDRPAYFIHLVEVAMHLQESGCDAELIAAGFLHDTIEDTDLTEEDLRREMGSERVANLVVAVTELDKGQSWERRKQDYLKRMRTADPDVLTLSCTDKLCNIRDMCSFLAKGFNMEDFTSRKLTVQVAKFRPLRVVYQGSVPESIFARFDYWLARMERYLEG